MALARPFRPDQHHRPAGPIRPALDQRKRRRIRRSAQKILARETFRMAEGKRELTRTGVNRHMINQTCDQPDLTPV